MNLIWHVVYVDGGLWCVGHDNDQAKTIGWEENHLAGVIINMWNLLLYNDDGDI